jgi:hypothetical protein
MALSEHTADTVCLRGKGEKCCRYLGMGPGGLRCMKLDPSLKALLDARVAQGTMGAKGDNCEGVEN